MYDWHRLLTWETTLRGSFIHSPLSIYHPLPTTDTRKNTTFVNDIRVFDTEFAVRNG
jgi:hypothetical protein